MQVRKNFCKICECPLNETNRHRNTNMCRTCRNEVARNRYASDYTVREYHRKYQAGITDEKRAERNRKRREYWANVERGRDKTQRKEKKDIIDKFGLPCCPRNSDGDPDCFNCPFGDCMLPATDNETGELW